MVVNRIIFTYLIGFLIYLSANAQNDSQCIWESYKTISSNGDTVKGTVEKRIKINKDSIVLSEITLIPTHPPKYLKTINSDTLIIKENSTFIKSNNIDTKFFNRRNFNDGIASTYAVTISLEDSLTIINYYKMIPTSVVQDSLFLFQIKKFSKQTEAYKNSNKYEISDSLLYDDGVIVIHPILGEIFRDNGDISVTSTLEYEGYIIPKYALINGNAKKCNCIYRKVKKSLMKD
jgi:hypothetical protein